MAWVGVAWGGPLWSMAGIFSECLAECFDSGGRWGGSALGLVGVVVRGQRTGRSLQHCGAGGFV